MTKVRCKFEITGSNYLYVKRESKCRYIGDDGFCTLHLIEVETEENHYATCGSVEREDIKK